MARRPAFWEHLPLVGRLLAITGLALLMAGSVVLYVSTYSEARESEADLRTQLQSELNVLPATLAELVVLGDYSTLQQSLNRFVTRVNVTRITFRDKAGVEVHSVDAPPRILVPGWFAGWLHLGDQTGEAAVQIGGQDYGLLTVTLTPEVAINRVWQRFIHYLSVLLVALLVDFLGVWLVLRSGLAPLRALDMASMALEKGDFSARAPSRGSPELRHSIETFNRMAEALEQFIEERRRREDLLQQERDFTDAVLATAGSLVVVIDREGAIVRFNRAAEAFTGYSFEEVRGKPFFWERFLSPEQVAGVRGVFEKVVGGHVVPRYENHWVSRDGRRRLFDWSNTLLSAPDGKMAYLITVGTDITDHKHTEEALRQLNDTLEQRVSGEVTKNMEQERLLIQQSRLAAMGEMIGNIAHQWRQPINALGLLLANIKDAYDFGEMTPEEMTRQVESARRMIEKMSSTIDDFRDFFRPDKEKTRFSVHDALVEVKSILGASLATHGITLEEAGEADVMAVGYPNEFSQVLLNLLNNAKEALLENKVADGRIRVTVGTDGAWAEIRVQDNAGGIPDGILHKIFDPYFTTKAKGTGIGLYMSKVIVENNMGGTVEARNVEEGAEFIVRVPREGAGD